MAEESKKTSVVEFRGKKFAYYPEAIEAPWVLFALTLAGRGGSPADMFEALDLVFCGHAVELLRRVPDADGNDPGPLGCSFDDLGALCAAVVEAAGQPAKN